MSTPGDGRPRRKKKKAKSGPQVTVVKGKKRAPAAAKPAAPVKKKKKKKRRSSSSSGMLPVILVGAGLGVVVIGALVFLVIRGRSDGDAPTGAAAAVAGVQTGKRYRWPTPSEDPKDWKTSYPAFAANLEVKSERLDRSQGGGMRWVLDTGQVNLAPDNATIEWEAPLKGRDTRSFSYSIDTAEKQCFGFDFEKLPKGCFVVFTIDAKRSEELRKLTFQRVRFKGKIAEETKVVWLDTEGAIAGTADGPKTSGEAPLVFQRDREIKGAASPVLVIECEITEFKVPS